MTPKRGEADDRLAVRLGPEAFSKHVGGVRRVTLEFADALRRCGVDVHHARHVNSIRMTSSAPGTLRRLGMQATEAAFPWMPGNRSRRGIHHALYYEALLPRRQWPVVVTVYDMIHERFDFASRRLRLAKSHAVRHAASVVAISESTARDVRQMLDPSCEIEVIRPGVAEALLAAEVGHPPHPKPYILFVGSRLGYKNFNVLFDAWNTADDLRDLDLLLVGGGPLAAAEAEMLSCHLAEGRIRLLDRASDELLAAAYTHASALVVCSRYEGFGLPVIEAMAFGCPVACSSGGSLPEAAGGHGALFEPDSPDQCADAIRRALSMDSSARSAARAYGRGHTWDRNAQLHAELYRTILEAV